MSRPLLRCCINELEPRQRCLALSLVSTHDDDSTTQGAHAYTQVQSSDLDAVTQSPIVPRHPLRPVATRIHPPSRDLARGRRCDRHRRRLGLGWWEEAREVGKVSRAARLPVAVRGVWQLADDIEGECGILNGKLGEVEPCLRVAGLRGPREVHASGQKRGQLERRPAERARVVGMPRPSGNVLANAVVAEWVAAGCQPDRDRLLRAAEADGTLPLPSSVAASGGERVSEGSYGRPGGRTVEAAADTLEPEREARFGLPHFGWVLVGCGRQGLCWDSG